MSIDNKKFYSRSLKQYGKSVKALHWNSKESQQIRFEQIILLLPECMQNYKIVDAGCGFADLYHFLVKSKKKPLHYIGIDSLDAMVKQGRKRTSCTILQSDVLKDSLIEADFYLCSGAMNIMSEFETHLFIRRCYEASKIGFIFNILWGDKEESIYNYMRTGEIKAIAKDLGARCEIITGYLEGDISVAFYKDVS